MFDFDSTLVDLRANDIAAVRTMLAVAGLDIDPERFVLDSLVVLEQAFDSGMGPGEDLHRFRLERTLALHGAPWHEGHLDTFLGTFLTDVPVYPGVVEALDQIGSQVPLGLVTNAVDASTQRARIEASGLSGRFAVVAIAADVGSSKPDPGIFRWAAARMGVPTHRCAFVGDSEVDDICGARGVGMRTVRRVLGPPVATPGTRTSADATFRDFADLPAILARLDASCSLGGADPATAAGDPPGAGGPC